MTSNVATVAEYLAELPPSRRADLEKLRALIRKVAPGISEGMKYGLPHYEGLCAFASQKQAMSFYAEPVVVDAYRAQLGRLNCGKGCIRFRKLADLPLDVAESILKSTLARRRKGIAPEC
jgi:uncharacterized protein YdhG (YjbR/CyaY superfamily)